MIATPEALNEFVATIAPHDRVAIDTEADSLHCYFEKLCLVQVSLPGQDVLIDPLAGFSLEPLFHALQGKELILQGADFDLRLLRRSGGMEAERVFDTMIGARLAGKLEFSLAALVQQYFGITLAKSSQKENWARRPLTDKMMDYAANDTRYLLPLAEKLEGELRALGRWEWFVQSCAKAVQTSKITRERDIENLWRISGSVELRGRASALLRALWNWRDEEAKAVDRPPFHILRNEELIEAARRFDAGERVSYRHLSGSRAKRFYAAAETALALPQNEWPVILRRARARPTPEEERRFLELKKKRDAAATGLNLDPSLIAPKATLEALAADPAAASERLLPWQQELLSRE
ncbi:MAG TPA: HRDC domain-containing protein [Chthoniobacteraceae bacterium]|nr:HRDC domain-containing protein [Chthoniobacteraceae bacterium]